MRSRLNDLVGKTPHKTEMKIKVLFDDGRHTFIWPHQYYDLCQTMNTEDKKTHQAWYVDGQGKPIKYARGRK